MQKKLFTRQEVLMHLTLNQVVTTLNLHIQVFLPQEMRTYNDATISLANLGKACMQVEDEAVVKMLNEGRRALHQVRDHAYHNIRRYNQAKYIIEEVLPETKRRYKDDTLIVSLFNLYYDLCVPMVDTAVPMSEYDVDARTPEQKREQNV